MQLTSLQLKLLCSRLMTEYDIRVTLQLVLALEILNSPATQNQGDFAELFGYAISKISRDLRILKRKGIIEDIGTLGSGKQRFLYEPTEEFYVLVDEVMAA